jgi:hypothetical protein
MPGLPPPPNDAGAPCILMKFSSSHFCGSEQSSPSPPGCRSCADIERAGADGRHEVVL